MSVFASEKVEDHRNNLPNITLVINDRVRIPTQDVLSSEATNLGYTPDYQIPRSHLTAQITMQTQASSFPPALSYSIYHSCATVSKKATPGLL